MWRSGSSGGGCDSGNVESGGHSRTSSGRHHHNPRRCHTDSSELVEPIKNEAIKFVQSLNQAVANTNSLAALIGGSGDGPHLRDELRRSRRTAQEAAAAAKATLLPSLLDQRWTEKERTELERIWLCLIFLLDALESSMQRSLALLRDFSLADGSNILIHTGLDHHLLKSHHSSAGEPSDGVALLDKLALEGVEASILCKELFELRSQLQELKSAVEIRSLSPPEGFDALLQEEDEGGGRSRGRGRGRRGETLVSMNGGDRDGLGGAGASSISCSIPSDDKVSIEYDDEGSQEGGITPAQRKCVCWVLCIMVTIFLFSMILGLVIALFS